MRGAPKWAPIFFGGPVQQQDANKNQSLREVVQGIREAVQLRLLEEPNKACVADFIRISLFERELRETVLAREVKVTWVDRAE